jgi:hypothetical protein
MKEWFLKNKLKWKKYTANYRNKTRQKRRKYNQIYKKIYRELHPWAKTWESITARTKYQSYYKNIKNDLSFNDLKFLWLRDKANLMNKPRIHRKNSKGNYTLKNCQYVELENHLRIHVKGRTRT